MLGVVLIVAACIRLHDLGVPELQWDEHLALHRASLPVAEMLKSLNGQAASDVALDTSPPLHHLLIHCFRLLKDDDFTVRLPFVLFGLASLAMLFLVARRFFDEQAALCSALYGALLQFHVAYSRYMRWYVVFYTFSLLSLYCYKRLLDDRTWRSALGYGLATTLMLYSSYIAAPFVLAQALFTCCLCLPAVWRAADRPAALRLALVHGLGLCLAGLLYLPQVPGQFVAFHTFYQGGGHAFDPYRLGKAFREITLYFRDSDFTGTGIVALFMLLGAVWSLRNRRGRDLALLVLWCGLPTLAAFAVNVQTQVTAKYLVGLFFAVLLFAGAGSAALARWLLGRRLAPGSGRHAAACLALGFAGILWISGPNFQYEALYRGWHHNVQRWARYLLLHKEDVGYVMFEYNRPKKVVLTRELRDAYRYFGDVDARGYRKFYYVTQQGGFEPAGLVRVMDMPQEDETVLFSRGGVVSQAPLVVSPGPGGAPVYTDDFTTLRFYETVWQAHNVAPDYRLHALSLYSLDAPGQATWKLVAAPGATCRSVAVRFDAVMRAKIRVMRPEARLRLYAGQDPDRLALVEDIDYDRFVAADPGYGQAGATGESTLPVAANLAWADPGKPLYVRLEFLTGRYSAYIDLERLRFEAAGEPGDAAARTPLAVLDNIAANAALAPWTPDVAPLGPDVLHAFCAADARCPGRSGAAAWQPAADLARFRAAHPGLPPVAVVGGADGEPVFYLYDPRLADSTVALPDGRGEKVAVDAELPWTVRGLSFTGGVSRPVLRLGRESLPIPLAVPEGSLVTLNLGGEGLVSLSPLFTPEGFDLYNMVRRDNLNILRNSLTCLKDRPCLAEYVFASEIPIKGVRAMIHPVLQTDKPNYARVFYGVNDIDARKVFLDFSERGPLDVSSTYEGVVREVLFDKPVNILFVGCELSGPGASIRSDPKYPMRIEVLLDASALPAVSLGATPTTLRQDSQVGGAMRLWLSGEPLPVREAWATR